VNSVLVDLKSIANGCRSHGREPDLNQALGPNHGKFSPGRRGHKVQTPNRDVLTVGFLMAGFAWTLWWNIDWQRFIKFYGISGPPYHPWIKAGFRIFFALCSLGAAIDLRRRLLEETRPYKFCWDALVVAADWFIVIVLLVKIVEWVTSKRRGKSTVSQ
jgi:hypothetical protein